MQLKKIFFTLSLFIACLGFGQQINFSGSIELEDDQKPFGQFIIFSADDSTLVKGSYIDSTAFNLLFDAKNRSNFYVRISVTEYLDTLISFTTTGENFTLPAVKLNKNRTLETVEVVFRKPEFQRTMDGIKVNVDGTTLQTLSNLFDVLVASPKLSSPDGERIEIIGRGSPLILIDRQAIISNDELKAIPANMISSIEIITNPSAKYKAQGRGNGVIEVFTKNFNLEGYNMNISSSFGLNTQLKPTSGLNMGINLKRKKFSLGGYLGGNYNTSYGYGNSEGFTTDDSQRSLSSNYTNENWNSWSYYQLKGAYQFNKQHTLTAGFRGNTSLGGNQTETISSYYQSGTLETSQSSFSDPSYLWLNGSAFLNYVWETDTNHSAFEANANLAQKSSVRKGTSISTYNDIANAVFSDFNIKTESYDKPLVLELRTNYEHVFDTSGWKLSFGGSFSELLNGKIYNQYNLQNEDWIVDDAFTNSYDYEEQIGAVFTEVTKNWQKIGLRLGLRGEYTKLSGYSNSLNKQFIDSSYVLPFPSASIMLSPTEKVSLTFSYSSGIERPQFSNFDPFVRISDSLNIAFGNPYLRPAVSNTFSMDIDLFYAYNLSISYSQSNDPISEIAFVSDSTFLTSTTPWNAAHDRGVSASLSLPLQFSWLQGWNSMWINYSKYTFTSEFNRAPFNNLTYGLYSYLTFTLPKNFSIMNQIHLSRWGSADFTGNTQFSWGIRLTKKYKSGNFQIFGEVQDIFPPKYAYTQYSGNYQYTDTEQSAFTSFKLGIFYKFGRLKQSTNIKESSSGQSGRI